jgi:hypothetical protein
MHVQADHPPAVSVKLYKQLDTFQFVFRKGPYRLRFGQLSTTRALHYLQYSKAFARTKRLVQIKTTGQSTINARQNVSSHSMSTA